MARGHPPWEGPPCFKLHSVHFLDPFSAYFFLLGVCHHVAYCVFALFS